MMYELLYIVPTQYTDPEVEAIKTTVVGCIESAGGKVSRNESLAKLKLAYPIKKVRHGTYVLVRFMAEPKAITVIDRNLRLATEVTRHQMIQMPEGVADRAFQMISYVAPLSEEGREAAASGSTYGTKPAAAAAAAVPAVAPLKRAEPSMSIEELDKKLDEILETDEKV